MTTLLKTQHTHFQVSNHVVNVCNGKCNNEDLKVETNVFVDDILMIS
jgi:hypothetical protein